MSSRKLHQKQTIPLVEKRPVITELEAEYRMIDCSSKAVENNKSVVQVNTCNKYSKNVCRRESIRVVESLTEIEKSKIEVRDDRTMNRRSNHEDRVIDRSIGNFSKTLQRIDSAVRENIRTNILSKRAKKWYEKESFQVLESMSVMKEAEKADYVGESNNGTVPKRKQADLIVRPIEFPTTSMKVHRKDNIKRVVKMSLFKEIDEFFARTETKEISNKDHLTSVQIEELNNDTDNDHDGFLENTENIEKNLIAQESRLSETLEIPQQENTNADQRSANHYSPNDGKSSVITEERLFLDKCEELRNNDNILKTTDLISLAKNSTAENKSLIPLSEDVGQNKSLETATSLKIENEPTKVHSQVSVTFTFFH